MIVIRYGATTRTVTTKGETVQRNTLTRSQDDMQIGRASCRERV